MTYDEWLSCRQCGETEFHVGTMQTDHNIAWRDVGCNYCGEEWRECYSFTHNQTTDGKMLDDDGVIVPSDHDLELLKEGLKEDRISKGEIDD